MIAVVTGGSGFIGSNLVERLLSGGAEVRCITRPRGGAPPAGAATRALDLADPDAVAACDWFDDADVVYHVAGSTRAIREREFAVANVETTRRLLDGITARRAAPRFVYVSSQAAAGPARDLAHPVREDDPPHPVEPYGRSKLAAERAVEEFASRLPVSIVRPVSVFGPRDRDFLVLFRMARRGLVIHPGNASQWVSLADIGEVVEALVAAGEHPRAIGRTYFVGGHGPVTWRALADLMAGVAGGSTRHLELPASLVSAGAIAGDLWGRVTGRRPLANSNKARLARPPFWVCSADRIRAELGVGTSRSLPEALAETYYWYQRHGWLRGSRRAPVHAA